MSDKETELRDEILVQRAVSGDRDSFDMLFGRHYSMIFGLAYRMTGSRAEAEDAAQETCLKAARALNSFRGDAQFKTWVYGIALNVTRDIKKKQVRDKKLCDEYTEVQQLTSEKNSRSGEVLEALAQLSEKERAAIVLSVYEGLSHAETAKALGCAETTISWRIFRAKAKLKKYFESSDEDATLESGKEETLRSASAKSK